MSDVTTLGAPSAPSAAGTVVLFDSTADTGTGTTLTRRRAFSHIDRVSVALDCDLAVRFKLWTLAKSSTDWHVVNGDGAGEMTTANTLFVRDNLVVHLMDDFKVTLDFDAVPSAFEVTTRLVAGDRSSGAA